jgi:hypothetical protein
MTESLCEELTGDYVKWKRVTAVSS